MDNIGALLMFLLIVSLYFFPTIIANAEHHKNVGAIFVLNLFLGWTLVGWVVALVWAAKKDDRSVGNKRVCPHCAETVLAAARVCRYCQHDLPPVRAAANHQVTL